ncbi:MAG: hypothetical protein R3E45_01880 [Rhodocyclaceae bacterium]
MRFFFVVEHPFLDMVQTDPLDVVHGALEVIAFAVELQEAPEISITSASVLHLVKNWATSIDAAVAGDVDLVARIDADDARP